MIDNSVGYDSIDMENELTVNEVDIIDICSKISNRNSEGHLHNV